ncbi:MAG: hypothetical protein OEY05_10300 [Paracoccaceae bacterium]|nr:hypothetical protein [Paracoccaceae bacterium]
MALIDKDAGVRHNVANHDAVSVERRTEPDYKHHGDQREGADHKAEQAMRAVSGHFLLRFSPTSVLSMLLCSNFP